MISVEGFGRPKFGNSEKPAAPKSQKAASKSNVCETCGQPRK